MIRNVRIVSAAAAAALVCVAAPVLPAELPRTERLTYSIEFGIIKAGTATLEIRVPERSPVICPTTEFVSRARSSPFFDHFYPVDDEVRSLVDASTLLPYRHEKRLSEGSYRAEERIVFDREANRVRYANGDTLSVPPTARDVLSSLYEVRRLRPSPGDSILFVNHTGKKTMLVQVRVLGREMVTTRVGRFRCLKTEPALASGGLFKNQGRLWVWFTDDERMIPVRMESKLSFGSIVAEIERVERPDLNLASRKSRERAR